jgi:hypothetical protein
MAITSYTSGRQSTRRQSVQICERVPWIFSNIINSLLFQLKSDLNPLTFDHFDHIKNKRRNIDIIKNSIEELVLIFHSCSHQTSTEVIFKTRPIVVWALITRTQQTVQLFGIATILRLKQKWDGLQLPNNWNKIWY